MAGEQLQTAISGSFKFKPEIDALHDEFADYGIAVLEPTKGWQPLPFGSIIMPDFRPLPVERGMSIDAIEQRFLDAIKKSDFSYVYNPESYIGLSAALEMGFAIGEGKPIYAKETPDFLELSDGDLNQKAYYEKRIAVASIAEIARLERARREQAHD